MCLSVDELFMIAFLKSYYRNQQEKPSSEWRFRSRKMVYARCCLAMGNCECSLSVRFSEH